MAAVLQCIAVASCPQPFQAKPFQHTKHHPLVPVYSNKILSSMPNLSLRKPFIHEVTQYETVCILSHILKKKKTQTLQ